MSEKEDLNPLAEVQLDFINEMSKTGDFSETKGAKPTNKHKEILGEEAAKIRKNVVLSQPVIDLMNTTAEIDNQDGSSVIRAALLVFSQAPESRRKRAYAFTKVHREKPGVKTE